MRCTIFFNFEIEVFKFRKLPGAEFEEASEKYSIYFAFCDFLMFFGMNKLALPKTFKNCGLPPDFFGARSMPEKH